MNIRKKDVPIPGKGKGKEGMAVKRDRELSKKIDKFNELLQKLNTNSNADIASDTE